MHPELKPAKKKKKKKAGSANVAETGTTTSAATEASANAHASEQEIAPQPFGFMNEQCGFAFVCESEEVNSAQIVFVISLWPMYLVPLNKHIVRSNNGFGSELAFPSRIDVSPIIGSLSEARQINAWIDNHRNHDALSRGSLVVNGDEVNSATSTNDCKANAHQYSPCHSNTCLWSFTYKSDRCMFVDETTNCKATNHESTRVYPNLHSCEAMGPSTGALTRGESHTHNHVVEQPTYTHNAFGEEVNSAGISNAPVRAAKSPVKNSDGVEASQIKAELAVAKPCPTRALSAQKSLHTEHVLEDGWAKYLAWAQKLERWRSTRCQHVCTASQLRQRYKCWA